MPHANSGQKTNVLRILDSMGIRYHVVTYPVGDEHLDAPSVARELAVSPDIVFKTLVAHDETHAIHVFCIPGAAALDLKKAAKATGSRKVELVNLKDLTPLTGYVRGGCSPIGMKKKYPTWIDEIASTFDAIYINAGARGMQVVLSPADACRAAGALFADLV